MTEQEKIKYAYELMVKNNPDEAVKTLIRFENNLKNLVSSESNVITFEDKMKNRDNGFLYDKCINQHEYIIQLQTKHKALKDKMEKLNYKIKELDDMFYETFRISRDGYFSISKWELKNFTNKVQELMLVGEDNE